MIDVNLKRVLYGVAVALPHVKAQVSSSWPLNMRTIIRSMHALRARLENHVC
jgi:hypothetical protein